MFKIGEFAKFTCVSIKQLRHYDELGLLKPRLVDPFTSYRYYSADQLPRLNRILALRDLGFTLEQTARLLDEDLPLAQMQGMLTRRRAEIEQTVQREQARLARVAARLQQIEAAERALPSHEVVVRAVEPQLVAALRQPIRPGSAAISTMFDQVERFAAQHKARAPHPPLLLYHATADQGEPQEREVMVPLTAPLADRLPITVRTLPGCPTMACVIHTGDYATLAQTFGALLRWVTTNHYQISGPPREVFLRFGADLHGYDLPAAYLTSNAAELVTELQVPVARVVTM